GVSSFGFSGTNVHVVLEKGLSADEPEFSDAPPLLVLSARDRGALELLRERWAELLAGSHPSLVDLCFTAAHRRSHHPWRLAAAGDDSRELLEHLRTAEPTRIGRGAPPLVFVFAGQGGVWQGMGLDLLASAPEVRQVLEDIDGLVTSLGGSSVIDALREGDVSATEFAQPALFALQVALVTWFEVHGIRPTAVVGHSVGELAAAWACGAMPLYEACRLVVARAAVMATLRGSGAMLAVGLSFAEVEAHAQAPISVAAVNGPTSCVLAGPHAALERVRSELTGAGRFARWVTTDYAFHSPAVTAASLRLHKLVGSVECTPNEVPMYSTVDGTLRAGPLDLAYWIRNMAQPVRFADAIAAIAEDMDALYVELGPHPALQIPIAAQLATSGKDPQAARAAMISTLRRDGHARVELAEAAGQLHARGVSVDLERLVPRAAVVSLPAYPWQRQRHRLPESAAASGPTRARVSAGKIMVAPVGWRELVRLDQPRPTWEATPGDGEQLDAGTVITLLLALVDAPMLDALMTVSAGIRRIHVERSRSSVEVWADAGGGWRELLNANLGPVTSLPSWSGDVVWESCPRSVLEAELGLLGHILGAGVKAIERGRAAWRLHLDGVTILRAFELTRALASLIHGEPVMLGGWGRLQGRGNVRVGVLVVTHTKVVMFDGEGRELLVVEAAHWDQDRTQLAPRSLAAADDATSSLRRQLEQQTGDERERMLADWIEQQARTALLHEGELPHDEGLFSLGMDSLLAISLLTNLAKAIEVSLPSTLVFEHPTVAALARAALGLAELGEASVAAPTPVQARDIRPLLATVVREAQVEAGEFAARDGHPRLTEPIAIVGVACRLPGASSPDAFWSLLEAGGDAVTTVPMDRWDAEAWTDPDPEHAGRMISAAGAFLGDITRFDPAFFGISPREAERMDPQQRLLLEVGYEALEHAGWPSNSLRGSQTGVFVGIGTEDFGQLQFHNGNPEDIGAYDFTGVDTSVAAGRLSHTWGLEGPCMAIDTACSSSLVALHLAAQSLRLGECDRALVGGVNVMLVPELGVFLSRARAMSPSGRCRTFDVAADGY
ncbi:MAG: acyltransferase domain-containing protein, partial [Myxococcales bacterium]|nr:acyltransferase domain-containing protein [Myxococcales bacterium]